MTPRRLIEPARLAGTALLHGQSDERLVDLTRAGNGRAFEAIVTRYRRPLLRHCARLLPPGRAEDAVQQAFLNAYRAIVAGENELRLRPWLYRIAHNASLNLLRQNGWDYDEIPADFDGVIQPPQAVEQSERIRELVRAVKDLPERQRDAVILRELEGRSYEEISAALGVTDGAVRQLLNRARNTLRGAATAITPQQLLVRLAERASTDAPTLGRIAEICTGAGGAATLAKVAAAVLVTGAVAGGVAVAPLHKPRKGRSLGEAAQAAELAVTGGQGARAGSAAGGTVVAGGSLSERGGGSSDSGLGQALALAGGGGGGGSGQVSGSGGQSGGGSGSGSSDGGGHHEGSGSGGGGDSGHGGGGSDHGGGTDGSGDGHSGSGTSGSVSGDGSSGSSGSSDGGGTSGVSGSSGSGSSGSGSDGGDSGVAGISGAGSSGDSTSGSGDSLSHDGSGDSATRTGGD